MDISGNGSLSPEEFSKACVKIITSLQEDEEIASADEDEEDY
jgi:hypothetical protein